jgi:hypothetical protein
MLNKRIKIESAAKDLVPVIVFCLAAAVIICAGLRVISYGFLPPDDAMRHSAKVISGKSWDQILVVRPEFQMDSHPGWHAILTGAHEVFGLDQDGLAAFSVVLLFSLFCLIPIFFLDIPEAWLAALLAVMVITPHLILRIFLGRPFIVSMSTILVLCFLWPRLKERKPPYGVMGALAALIALSTWIHASWYLFALPVACFFLAREYRAGARLALAAAVGVIAGALLTGHPALFLKQTLVHAMLAFGNVQAQRLLVGEFQSFGGEGLFALFVLGILAWRSARGKWDRHVVDNPVFIMAVTGWALGFVAARFWTDWGMPAAIFWVMTEFSGIFSETMKPRSWRRVIFALAISGALFLSITVDANSRWTYNLTAEYLSEENPKQRGWLPEPGGIIYSADMNVFYQTFFKNPKAPWRYILGFEPAMMPPEDLAILRKIHWNYETSEAYKPWIEKMRPSDRLVVRGGANAKPNIPELDWFYAATNTWVGRLR